MTDTPGWNPPVEPGEDAPGWGSAPPPPAYGTQYGGQYGAPQYGGQNSPWGAPPAARPGVVPLRPLAVGEILDGSFGVIREYPRVTLGLAAIVTAVTQTIGVLLVLSSLRENGYSGFGGPLGSADFSTASVIGFLVALVANVMLAGMLTAVMGDAVLGREATLGSIWARVRPRLWALLGAAFVTVVVPVAGLFFFVIPGVFLWGAWALVTPALILERIGVGAALRRSWRLAVPDWWRVWGIRALATVISFVLSMVIVLPFVYGAALVAGDGDKYPYTSVAIVLLGQVVAGTVTAPFTSGVVSLLYIDRRMRAEGLDVSLAQAAATQGARL